MGKPAYCEIVTGEDKVTRVFASEPFKDLPELEGVGTKRHFDHWEIEPEGIPKLVENLRKNKRRFIKSK